MVRIHSGLPSLLSPARTHGKQNVPVTWVTPNRGYRTVGIFLNQIPAQVTPERGESKGGVPALLFVPTLYNLPNYVVAMLTSQEPAGK